MPGDEVAALGAENGRPGEANERLRMLLADKDAQIAALTTQNSGLAERVARLERLVSRNPGSSPGTPGCRPSRTPPEPRPETITQRSSSVTQARECLRRCDRKARAGRIGGGLTAG